MHLADIDTFATSGLGPLHRASPRAKLAASAMLIAAVMVSTNVLVIFALALAVLAGVIVSGLPVRRVLALAAYPLFFAVVFAVSASAGVLLTSLIIGKAFATALVAVTLVYTTPYPQIFAPLQRVTPPLVGDALLATYRSFFLMLDKLARLVTAVKLRAGLPRAGLVRNGQVAVRSLGGLVLYSLDVAQRDYDVLRLRGYDRRLRVAKAPTVAPAIDAVVMACGALLFAVALAWRYGFEVLGPYSWLPPLAALAVVPIAAFARVHSKGASR